ncbi:putative membrane protein [Propionispora sp. 2/2-37]|uniref:DMT family transporter n=1 Tax=Propionispora sp. 2/2-37 TaxID=1677858 RepID=UPI0006BB8803|nr:DMT family transporter [Propionispora sp. 2/2-37]CUH96061.1 putative membrane protein [Propionispora sp. 2/2-37]
MKRYLGSLYLAMAASIWGGMYVVSKVVLTVIAPLELVWIRYAVALAALVSAGSLSRQSWRIRRQDLPLIACIGIIGYFVSIWAQFWGTQLSTAQMGAVITSATPAFMVLFARVLLKEAITVKKAVAVFLATAGVLCIVGIEANGSSFQLGGLILGVAALTWALMSVLVKKVPADYSALVVTTYGILAAAIALTPLFVTQANIEKLQLAVSEPAIWQGILYLGIVSTAGAFYLWNKGLQMVDATQGSLYFFFQPLVGTLLGWLFLGEQVGLAFWLGAILILSGVLLVIRQEQPAAARQEQKA